MAASGDAGMCQEGVFCPPKGVDNEGCGSLTLESDVEVTRVPGNLLVIFDQSGSMDDAWGNAGSKLQTAQNALVQAITPLQDLLTVGALFFPTVACVPIFPPAQGGAVQPITGPQQIQFMAAPQFLTAWQNHWTNRPPGDNIGTPMQEAFDRADVAIQSAALTGELVVVAFTDGAPNCFPADDGSDGSMGSPTTLTGVPTMREPDRAAGWLADRSIKTYMVGLPGAAGANILNDVAVSGGTMQYVLPDNPADLETLLRTVVSETVKQGFDTCMMKLDPPAELPDKLHVVVNDGDGTPTHDKNVPRDLQGGGWTINADGSEVVLEGNLCQGALEGQFSAIRFEYGCIELPPLPPVIVE
jgi:hypothetical protein